MSDIAIAAPVSDLLLAYGTTPVTRYLGAALIGGVVEAEVDLNSFLVRRYFGRAVFGTLYEVTFGIFGIGAGRAGTGSVCEHEPR